MLLYCFLSFCDSMVMQVHVSLQRCSNCWPWWHASPFISSLLLHSTFLGMFKWIKLTLLHDNMLNYRHICIIAMDSLSIPHLHSTVTALSALFSLPMQDLSTTTASSPQQILLLTLLSVGIIIFVVVVVTIIICCVQWVSCDCKEHFVASLAHALAVVLI